MRQDTEAARRLGDIATSNPSLTLLAAYSRDWVIPLFSEHLETVEDSVSAEWFHERVTDALLSAKEEKDWQGDRSPSAHCAWWIQQRWLDTDMLDGRVRYRLSSYSLRALQFVRELADGENTVSGARLTSIAHAVRRLADMTSPDKSAQLRRIDEEIAELQQRRDRIEAGQGHHASTEQMGEQLREVLAMTRSLPADFRHLCSLVEERHKATARDALTETPKAEMVERYLTEHDLLAQTREGQAYRRFSRMLSSSEESETIQRDIEQILRASFAKEQMTPAQRQSLDGMYSNLMSAELSVQQTYVRWTSSLRRVLTRAAHGRRARLLALTSLALDAGADWIARDPRARATEIDADVLGVGVLDVQDVTQMQLWQEPEDGEVRIETTITDVGQLPAAERAALRLAAGTGHKAVTATINRLLAQDGVVTAEDVYNQTPAEFQRLGTLVTLLDLAGQHGDVDPAAVITLTLTGDREHALDVQLPQLTFATPIEKVG